MPTFFARPIAAALLALGLITVVPTAAVAAAVAADVPAQAAAAAASAPAAPAPAAPAASAAETRAALDARVQALKAEVMRLNRDLLVLEEDLLFPPGTQLAVFVSLDVGKLFELESVKVQVDDTVVASHLYTAQEVQALQRGGVQRLYLGNLRTGKHQIAAYFTGRGPHERDYKRAAKVELEKGTDPKYVELKIRDKEAKLQPEFEVKVWP